MQLLCTLLHDCITAYDEKGALTTAACHSRRRCRYAHADQGSCRYVPPHDVAVCRRGHRAKQTSGLCRWHSDSAKRPAIRALDLLIKKEYEMRINLRADIVLETAVMGIMAPEDDAHGAASSLRLDKLEARLERA